MIMSETINGYKCVYDLPDEVKTAEQMQALICGYNHNESQREELQEQPKLIGLNGPLFNGFGQLASTGEDVVIIRYEKPIEF